MAVSGWPSAPAPAPGTPTRTTTPTSPSTYSAGAIYGPPWPLLYGTARVDRKILYLGTATANRGVFYQTGFNAGDWASNGKCAPTVLGFCAGATEALTLYFGNEKRAIDGYTVTPGTWSPGVTLRRLLAGPGGTDGSTPPWLRTAGQLILSPSSSPSFLTGAAVGMVWKGLVQFRSAALTLTGDTKVPDMGLELVGLCAVSGSGARDAHPIDVLRDLLINQLGIPTGNVITDVGPDGLAASSARRYVDNMTAFRVSRCITERVSAADAITSLLEVCNCEWTESEGKIKIWALGDLAVGTFTPSATAIVLNSDDLGTDQYIEVEQTPESETYNVQPVGFKDRTKDYQDNTINYQDDLHVETYGARIADSYSNDWITTSAHAQKIAQIMIALRLRQRNKYKFTLGPRWLALEVGDLVQISDGLNINNKVCRICKIEEDEEGRFKIEAWEWTAGNVTPVDLTTQESEGGRPLTEVNAGQQAQGGDVGGGSVSQGAMANPTTDNLYPNPTSETVPLPSADLETAEWADRYSAGSGWGGAYAGAWVRRLVSSNPPPHNVANNGEAFGTHATIRAQDSIPHLVRCVPGEVFYFEVQAKLSVKANSGTRAGMYITFLDADGNLSGTVYAETGDTAWTKLSVTTAAAPAGTCYVAFVYRVDCTSSLTMGETADFDGFLARRTWAPMQLTTATPAAGFTSGAGELALRYWVDGSQTVHFRGGVYRSINNGLSTLTTLPAGLRPLAQRDYVAWNATGAKACGIGVLADGSVNILTVVDMGEMVLLDGVTFLVEA